MFNLPHSLLNRSSEVGSLAADLPPMSPRRDLEAVVFGESGVFQVSARLGGGLFKFFFINIADPFEKKQWKNELFVIARVNNPS